MAHEEERSVCACVPRRCHDLFPFQRQQAQFCPDWEVWELVRGESRGRILLREKPSSQVIKARCDRTKLIRRNIRQEAKNTPRGREKALTRGSSARESSSGGAAAEQTGSVQGKRSESRMKSTKPMHDKAGPMHSLEKLDALHKEKSLDSPNGNLHLNDAVKDDELKKCHREVVAPNKYNSQYHKLFKDIPTEESVLKVCSCALQRDILIQGRLYISPNWLCFYANLFGKDIKVVIPVVSVQLIKKHKTARLLPNGLAITTNASRKYIFVSLISRDSVYDVLRRVCTHLQVSSKKSLSLKELTEEPDAVALEVIVPEVKWRKGSSASLSLALPLPLPLPEAGFQCIHRASISSLSTKESSCNSEEPLISESGINTEEELEVEPSYKAELRPSDYQLLKIFIVLICLLVVSSSYLAFRIFRLEQQLCSLNRDYLSRVPRR